MTTLVHNFKDEGFTLIKGLINPAKLNTYLHKIKSYGQADPSIPGALGFYKEPIFEKLLQYLLPFVEEITQLKLYKTYSYARIYHLGDELKFHKDRKSCEITVSLSLGYEGSIWPLWIIDKNNVRHPIYLEPGDAAVFNGVELVHGREINNFGSCTQAFLHYVDQKGKYSIYQDDPDDSSNDLM